MRVFENANTKQKKRTVKNRKISNDVYWMGAVDWNRRLFDSLIPLPDGTSYNAYLVQGTEKTVLIDSVDPEMTDVLERQLDEVENIDFVVAQHAEQDHSGAISFVLEKYENAIVLCSLKAKDLLMTHLDVPANRIRTVEDGETLQLGEKQLQFIYTPWVHWPDTMVTYLPQERILFTCDFFGSHFATSDLYAGNNPAVIQAAKRYYAEIMMPFRSIVKKNIDKIRGFDIAFIAPSHGPIFDHPEQIVSAYESWVSEHVSNVVVLPYISMHGSTAIMVNHLMNALIEKGVTVKKFELSSADIGKLAMALVDAATIVIGTPTVLTGPHPAVFSATHLANALRPKLKYAAVIGSYGWATKAIEQVSALIPNINVEVLATVMCKGLPQKDTFTELDALAEEISKKHAELEHAELPVI